MKNLSVIFPGSTRLENALRAYRVFFSFAASATDAVRAREQSKGGEASLGSSVDWEVIGVQHFEEIADTAAGAVVLTAHMGNYDVAAPVFSEKFRRRLNTVRAPEKTPEQQEYRRRELEGQQTDSYSVRYNSPESVLGLELTQALTRGEIVAIQGDRILFEVSALDAPFDADHSMAVPKGPFVLALTTGCRIHPLFILRLGRRRYRVTVRPPIECRAAARGPQARERAIHLAACQWMEELAPLMRQYWHQWYVFESAFTPCVIANKTEEASDHRDVSPPMNDTAPLPADDADCDAPTDEFVGLEKQVDPPSRCSTSLFKALCGIAEDAQLLGNNAYARVQPDDHNSLHLWANRPGQNSIEAASLALLSIWLVGGVIAGGLVGVIERTWWTWPLALVSLPVLTLAALQLFSAAIGLIGSLLLQLGIGRDRNRERILLWLNLLGLTALAVCALQWQGPMFLAAAIPWLLWVVINYLAWAALLFRDLVTLLGKSPALNSPEGRRSHH